VRACLACLLIVLAACPGPGAGEDPAPDAAPPDAEPYCVDWPVPEGLFDPHQGICTERTCYDDPSPDLAACPGPCDGLGEAECLTTSACRALYDASANFSVAFWKCAGTAPSGPLSGTSCYGLGTAECSRHDDCAAVHYYVDVPEYGLKFDYCAPERWTEVDACAGVDCGTGRHCELQCHPCSADAPEPCWQLCHAACQPDPGTTCDTVTCPSGSHCEEVCTGELDVADARSCVTECRPDQPLSNESCIHSASCPPCPEGFWQGSAAQCTGTCIVSEACGSPAPGDCFGTVTCGEAPPPCPDGMTPGVLDGCYTGHCIPTEICDPATRSCESKTTEAACLEAAPYYCVPVYAGTGCTCAGSAECECETWTFSRCE